jgi:magnesium-transporting ATPase (P-type)
MVLMASLVDTLCLDKTGTLTNNFVEVGGLMIESDFLDVEKIRNDKTLKASFLYKIMGTCHSL